ncbi:MAG: hypothetical protein ACP5KS_08600, partial [Candidatus Hydrogenedens sp.]
MSNYLKWLLRWHILLSIFLILLCGSIWSYRTYKFYDKWLRQLLLTQVINIAEGINPNNIEKFHASGEDLENPIYQSLQTRLRSVRAIIPRCKYLYLMGRTEDKKIFFYMDTQEDTEETPP